MKTRLVIFSFIATGFIFSSSAFSCPCHPCKCSPCTCGGMGSKSSSGGGGKHHDHDHHGHHDHSGGASVGVGVDVDLSGIGHRSREADPFAAGGGDKPVAHTEEKRITKKKEHEPTTTNFDEIKLTGIEGKGDLTPPSTFNVNNDDTEEAPKLPAGEVFTKEKPKTVTKDDLQKTHDKYFEGVKKYREDNWAKTKTKDEFKKVLKLRDEFDKTDEGKKLIADWKEVYDKLVGPGMKIGTDLMPPPQNEMEKKKYHVASAQENLESREKEYQWKKDNASGNSEEVKKLQQEMMGTTDPQKSKEIHNKIEEAWKKAGNDWASSDEAKEQMKKVHEAEKELDKAKEAWKPFEKYEEKKSASNP